MGVYEQSKMLGRKLIYGKADLLRWLMILRMLMMMTDDDNDYDYDYYDD